MTGSIRTVKGKDTYWIDGVRVTRKAFFAAFPDRLGDGPAMVNRKRNGHWPMVMDSMAVLRKDVKAAIEMDRAKGAPPTEYTPLGQPIVTSEAHKRAYIRAHGYHDRNAYYT